MKRSVFVLIATLVLVLRVVGQAHEFLPADFSALVNLLPPPPAVESPAGRADLATVLQVQLDRTPEQVKRAQRVANQSVTSFARPVLGEWFQSKDFPKTVAIFERINRESQLIVDDQVKKKWNRTRPYLFCAAVQPIVGRPDNTSYPSGHSAAAALWGTILAAAFPEQAAAFKAQIQEAAWCRVMAGVHYPSDTAAGQMLGTAIAEAMLKSPNMEAALQVIRDEITPHLKAASKIELVAPVK
ncbi:MAG: phosphatase PAP2 family protein [Verrucomicrobiota bacterium]